MPSRQGFPKQSLRALSAERLVQRPRDIGEEVGRCLTADAEADEALPHVVPAPARATLRRRVHAPEARGLGDQLAGGKEPLRALAAAYVEGHDRPEAAHLPGRQLVARVVG